MQRRHLIALEATAGDTGGQMTIVVEVTEQAGAEAPLHVHHRDDEAFWILEGDVTFDSCSKAASETAATYRSPGSRHELADDAGDQLSLLF